MTLQYTFFSEYGFLVCYKQGKIIEKLGEYRGLKKETVNDLEVISEQQESDYKSSESGISYKDEKLLVTSRSSIINQIAVYQFQIVQILRLPSKLKKILYEVH